MNKKTYQSAPNDIKKSILSSKVIKDFLPPPEELVFKEDTIKVTINLSKNSISFFKQYAKKAGGSYQQMIKILLDRYAQKYQH